MEEQNKTPTSNRSRPENKPQNINIRKKAKNEGDIRLSSLGIECFDHHLGLAFVRYKEVTLPHHALDRVGHFVEAVGRALLLRQTQDTQVVALAMLDHCDDLASK